MVFNNKYDELFKAIIVEIYSVATQILVCIVLVVKA